MQALFAILLGGLGVFLYVFIIFVGMGYTASTDPLLTELAKGVYFGLIGTIIMTIFWLPCSLVNYCWLKYIYAEDATHSLEIF